jgi:hypothetical protein
MFAIALAISSSVAMLSPTRRTAGSRWYRGNTHTHTLNSDGDSAPDEVARWYREHGYQFLVLSDHNYLTNIDGLNATIGAADQYLLIPGEEVTDRFGDKPIHINGLDVKSTVQPQGGSSVLDVVQRDVDAIRAASGMPSINHPNFGWSISPDELKQVKNTRLFEIFNGHPLVNNVGGGGLPGLEEAWDSILSSGVLLYGIAVDDAHHFKRPWDPTASQPGRGWIMVRADSLTKEGILRAIERGDFYASTGVELSDYQVTPNAMTITVKQAGMSKYRIQFIGRGGKVLQESIASPATYAIKGDEGYVRARVVESNGHMAWTQPVVIGKR